MPKEKLDKYMKEIHYGLSIRQTKTQSSGNPMNQKQGMERRVIKHTLFFWILTRRLLTATAEGRWARWAFKLNQQSVILIHLSEETWNYYYSFKLEEIAFSQLRGKRFPFCKWRCYFSQKETNIVHFTFHVFPLWKSVLSTLLYFPEWTNILKAYKISS